MTVQSQILRCMNNRLRNTEETVKLSNRKKPFTAALLLQHEAVANTRTQPTTLHQSEPSVSLRETRLEVMQETRHLFPSRRHDIFRQQLCNATSLDDPELEDMLVLKRANPVYDSDDEEEINGSPLKRQKPMNFEDEGESLSSVSWDDRLIEDELRGFSIDSPTAIGAH